MVKAWHGLNKTNLGSMLGFNIYNVADLGDGAVGNNGVRAIYAQGTAAAAPAAADIAANSFSCGFAIACDFDLFPNRSDIIISGTNSLSSQIFFEFNMLNAIAAAAGSYTLDTYAQYDAIFILQDGILTARF
jgi:hypothetical protein